jgi:transposase-like protein
LPGRPRHFTPEFKEQAVRRVIENSEPTVKVARELDMSDKTLSGWVSDYRRRNADKPLPESMPDQDRIRELERRNRELEMEVAFLKKAAAYFAKEQR